MVSVPETGLYGAFPYLRRSGDCFCDHDADTGVSRTITAIGQQFPSTMEAIKNWAVNLAAGYPDIVDRIMEIDIAWDKVSESAINLIKNGSGSLLSSTFNFATSVVQRYSRFCGWIIFCNLYSGTEGELEASDKGSDICVI